MRVAILMPCVSVGGADGLTQDLVRQSQLAGWMECTGVALEREHLHDQINRCLARLGDVPLHQTACEVEHPKVCYHTSYDQAAIATCDKADVAISWCLQNGSAVYPLLNCPVVEWIQNTDTYAWQVANQNAPHASYYVACSQAAAELLDPTRYNVRVIYNAVDPARITPSIDAHLVRENLRVPDGQRVLLFLGRLEAEKRPDLVLHVVGRLKGWHAIICGSGKMRAELERLGQVVCPGRFTMMHGVDHVGDVLGAADVFMLASDFEGDPIALHEAHLAGVPAVISDLPVIDELHGALAEGDYPPLSVVVSRTAPLPDWCQAVLTADSQDWRKHVVPLAHQVTRQNFTVQVVAEQWRALLTKVVEQTSLHRQLGRPKFPSAVRLPLDRCT